MRATHARHFQWKAKRFHIQESSRIVCRDDWQQTFVWWLAIIAVARGAHHFHTYSNKEKTTKNQICRVLYSFANKIGFASYNADARRRERESESV